MDKLILESPFAVADALAKGKKLMIFAVDDEEKPILPLSGISVKKTDVLPKNRDVVKPALKYVTERYKKPIRLDTLADLCDVSKSYFCRMFKETVGVGVGEYVIRLRMEEACRLLETTDMTVVAVAVDVGYVDCGYFNKLFKKRFGLTPLEYRAAPKFSTEQEKADKKADK